jgi:hypothetical protein
MALTALARGILLAHFHTFQHHTVYAEEVSVERQRVAPNQNENGSGMAFLTLL